MSDAEAMCEIGYALAVLRELRTLRLLLGGLEVADLRAVDQAVTAFRFGLPVCELERAYQAVSLPVYDRPGGCGFFDKEARN